MTVTCADTLFPYWGSLVGPLMESDLFEHTKGAFAGAQSNRGPTDVANGGKAFFDEIGDLTLDLEVKLLRVLQEREYRPVGSHHAMRHFLAISFSAIAAVAVTPKAIADTVKAGAIIEIRFSTTAPCCPSGACDVLELFPNEAGSFFATDVTVNLFDGNALLGTYFSASCCVPTFRSTASLFQAGSSTLDFTAIDSGTINGIIDMAIATGFLTWPSAPTPSLLIGHAIGPGLVMAGTGIQVTSVTISSVPEPSTIFSFLSVLVFLGFRQCRAHLRASFPPALSSSTTRENTAATKARESPSVASSTTKGNPSRGQRPRETHIVLDNLSAHKTKAVAELLEDDPKVRFHFQADRLIVAESSGDLVLQD